MGFFKPYVRYHYRANKRKINASRYDVDPTNNIYFLKKHQKAQFALYSDETVLLYVITLLYG